MLTSIWIWLLWISIHALLAESDRAKTHHAAVHVISIHALLAESDKGGYNVSIDDFVFLTTLFRSIHALLAESDGQDLYYVKAKGISIHALLAESDWKGSAVICPLVYFYPRSPCGERPWV